MSMRITQNMMNQTLLSNLQVNYNALSKTQQQLSSGKLITKPSDNPVSAVRAMYYQNSLNEINQYKTNASDGTSWMQTTDDNLGQVSDMLQRIRELTVQASNGTNTPTDLQGITTEMSQLKDQLGQVANSDIGGDYLFAGTDTKTPPYDTTKGAFTNTNQQDITYQVGKSVSVPVNVKGVDVFNHNGGMFTLIDNIVSDINNGVNPTDQLNKIDDQINNLSAQRSDLGARMNRMSLNSTRLDDLEQTTTSLLSTETDVDIPKAMVNLSSQQSVYQSALSAGAKIIQPSLVDFLK